jgi:hypothetical protein
MNDQHPAAEPAPATRPSTRSGRSARVCFLAAITLFAFPSAAVGDLNPVDVSVKGESGSRPRIGSDGAGNIVAIWRAAEGTTSTIRAALRPAGESWEPARRISAPGGSTESPRLGMDSLGTAVAVWQRSTGHDSIVQAAVRPAGGTWNAPETLSRPGDLAFNPQVAVRAGRITAVWTVLRERRTSVESSSRTVAGPWSPVQALSGPTGNTTGPVVAVDDRGGAVAAWQWSDGAFLVVQAAVRATEGTWSAPQVISGPGRSASQPQVAMDASGNAIVGWLRYNGSWTAAQVVHRPAGGAWEAVQDLSERGGGARRLDLVMNSRGDAVATWTQARLVGAQDLWSSFRAAGAERWNSVLVSANWRGLDPHVALDEQGNATAVWNGFFTVSASFKPAGEPWQDDYLLSAFDDHTAQPAVTTQRPENATAIWVRRSVEANEADDYIQAVSYDVNTYKEEAEEEEEEGEEGEEEEEEEEEEAAFAGRIVRGTPVADTIVGTPGADIIYGFGGRDRIVGRGGRDVVYGGAGDDVIVAGPGSDRLHGGLGSDRLVGGPGTDVLRGGSGSDVLRGDRASDRLYGGSGRDRLVGGSGADRLYGGFGRDHLRGGRGDDMLDGGRGNDLLSGGSGNDAFRARDGRRDAVFGGMGLDFYRLDRWLDRALSIESRL